MTAARHLGPALALSLSSACLPDNPQVETESDTATTAGDTTDTGAAVDGLFACDQPECTFLVVSQTLDDRIDVFEVAGAPALRGRVDLDLKPDPSGLQIDGELLDEPFGLALVDDALHVLVGHYPTRAAGSLLTFPLAAFSGLAPGAVFPTSDYFDGVGGFKAGVRQLPLGRQEAIFALAHPSGRLLVGAFANDLRALDWPTPGQLLVIDPADPDPVAIGAFDLGGLDEPCRGAWGLVALDDAVSRVALACDGSDSVAVLSLPATLGAADPAVEAAQITGCGVKLAAGTGWTTRSIAPDGAGKVLVIQSQLLSAPRLWTVDGDCAAIPSTQGLSPGFEALRLFGEVHLLRAPGGGDPALWLAATGAPAAGVHVIRGGATPTVCGRVGGLDGAFTAPNVPYALALDLASARVAIAAGPPSNPELDPGRGQVLWATLEPDADACSFTAVDLVDLSAGRFVPGDPRTWMRAPNVMVIHSRAGGGA